MNGETLREHLKNATRRRHAALDAFIGSLDTPDMYRASPLARHAARQAASVRSWQAFVAALDQASFIDQTAASRAACQTFDVAHTAMRMAFGTSFKGSS